jgi:para-aminobenzoate synthetase / 4-amino-4-deoxychorismate lyase
VRDGAGAKPMPREVAALEGGRAGVVRLDASRPGREGRSFAFSGHRGVLRADRLEQVLPLLRRVDRAAAGGLHAVGFVAYEAAAAFEPALCTRPPDPRIPLAWFSLHERRRRVRPVRGGGLEDPPGPWTAELDAAAHHARVEAIRELLAAGDSYQVNLTFRLRAAFRGSAATLYRTLCRAQGSSFCAHLELGEGTAIVSASPELFFHRRGSAIRLRPMKGTRPRGRWPAEDAALAVELGASEKDRSENLMIVDLLRNDVGRVAETGSVRVEDPFRVERYETVHQMTSTISARLRPGVGTPELFRALFPCGSVTGAPKIRTMEIIRDLETSPRGVYCGAIGVVSPGESVFSVAIRTLLLGGGEAELGVGSGITWGSDPAEEYRECWTKASFTRSGAGEFRLLETILYGADGRWSLLAGHLDRLAASAAYFGFVWDRPGVEEALSRVPAGPAGTALVVRLTLGRGGDPAVDWKPLASTPDPVRVAVADDLPVDSSDRFLYHKTTLRGPYERRLAARPGADDVLLVNERGELTESTVANLVVALGGELRTPPLDSGLLPGVLRAELVRTRTVRERVIRPEDLSAAEGIWLVGSVRGWRAAELAEERSRRSGGPPGAPPSTGAAAAG